ncbi:membrane protein [Flavonifractor plautii]|nr:membrane protein [Flavonifractor plautii]
MRKAVLSLLLWTWTGTTYFFVEVVFKTLRGRPETISWTMLALAILLAIPLERFGAELPWDCPLWLQALICGTAITAAELAAGLVLNICLGMAVWDYSSLPGNLWGQICPQFWALWCLLSLPMIVILDWLRYAVEGGETPHYTMRFYRRIFK